jgi:hypothetical protein
VRYRVIWWVKEPDALARLQQVLPAASVYGRCLDSSATSDHRAACLFRQARRLSLRFRQRKEARVTGYTAQPDACQFSKFDTGHGNAPARARAPLSRDWPRALKSGN